LTEGANITITGVGSVETPYVISADGVSADRLHRWTDAASPITVANNTAADISTLFDADVGAPTSLPGTSLGWSGSVAQILADGIYSVFVMVYLETRPDLDGWCAVQIVPSNENPGVTFPFRDTVTAGGVQPGFWFASTAPGFWMSVGDTFGFQVLNQLGASAQFSGADLVVARVG
jgi:hypothetical protein